MLSRNTATPIPSDRKGLYPVGTAFYRNGREQRGIGVNHWGAFITELDPLGAPSNYVTDFADIKQTWGLPFVRMAVGMYSRATWYNQWHLNKAAFYAKLDEVVARAEALGLGIVAVLVWGARGFTDACYDIYGTFEPPKNLAYKHTKAWQLFETFVTEVVTRYKNSPAIWAWQLGNEVINTIGAEYHPSWKVDGTDAVAGAIVNWGTKPGGGTYAPSDKMTMAEWQAFSQNAVALINSLDEHRRCIFGGSPLGNSFAVKIQTANSLAADTLADWNGVASTDFMPWIAYREKAFSGLGQHVYPRNLADSRFFSGAEKTAGEIIALSKAWADQVGKPFYLGEFGATRYKNSDENVDEVSTDAATEQAAFNEALNVGVIAGGVKLASVWNWSGDVTSPVNTVPDWMRWKLTDATRTYQLTAIAAANAAMQV